MFPACRRCVVAPLGKTRHFVGQVDFLAALGFHDYDGVVSQAHNEVRGIGGQVAVGFHIVDIEANRQVVLGESRDILCFVQKGREFKLETTRIRLGYHLGKDGLVRLHEGPMARAERPDILQSDRVVDARRAGVGHRDGIYGLFERIENRFGRRGLRQVAQHLRVFQIDRTVLEQLVAHKIAHLWVKYVIAADQTQFLEQLSGKEANDRAIISRANAFQLNRVMRLIIEHGLEHDFARLLGCKGFQRRLRVVEV